MIQPGDSQYDWQQAGIRQLNHFHTPLEFGIWQSCPHIAMAIILQPMVQNDEGTAWIRGGQKNFPYLFVEKKLTNKGKMIKQKINKAKISTVFKKK